MKILHIVQFLRPGGIEQFVLTLLKADFENTYLFALEDTPEQAISAWPILAEFRDHLVFANMKSTSKKEVVHLIRKTCLAKMITSVHTHYSAPLLYGSLASFGLNITHVHTEHDTWHLSHWKPRLIERFIFLARKKIHLVAVSLQIQNDLKVYFPQKKAELIHNAIDTDYFVPGDKSLARSYFKLPPKAILIGSAGRLCEIKGHLFLIEALKNLREPYQIVIAGDGPLLDQLLILVKELDLSHRVHFLGLVNNMNLFYQACDMFCLPSLDEGLPLTLLEAQSANLPTVCSNVGSCAEAVDPCSGILVQPKDPTAISQACLLISEKNGEPREFIRNNFSLETLRKSYMKLYLGGRNDVFA